MSIIEGIIAAKEAYKKATGRNLEGLCIGAALFEDLVKQVKNKFIVYQRGSTGAEYPYSVMVDGVEVTP